MRFQPSSATSLPSFLFYSFSKVLRSSICIFLVVVCCCLVSKLYLTLCDPPWTVACQAPLSIGFSRQEYWSELPLPSPGNLPGPRIEPVSPPSLLHWQTDSLPLSHQGSPHIFLTCIWFIICFFYENVNFRRTDTFVWFTSLSIALRTVPGT